MKCPECASQDLVTKLTKKECHKRCTACGHNQTLLIHNPALRVVKPKIPKVQHKAHASQIVLFQLVVITIVAIVLLFLF